METTEKNAPKTLEDYGGREKVKKRLEGLYLGRCLCIPGFHQCDLCKLAFELEALLKEPGE